MKLINSTALNSILLYDISRIFNVFLTGSIKSAFITLIELPERYSSESIGNFVNFGNELSIFRLKFKICSFGKDKEQFVIRFLEASMIFRLMKLKRLNFDKQLSQRIKRFKYKSLSALSAKSEMSVSLNRFNGINSRFVKEINSDG